MVSLALTTLAMVVEYDGTRYCGFQRQRAQPTVQQSLEEALSRFTGEEAKIKAASRTDTGVHAKAQVVTFRTTASYSNEVFVRALNYYLPKDISVKAAYRVRDGFDARREALSREYRYTILNTTVPSPLAHRFSQRVDQTLDIPVMQAAAQLFVGRHDYSAFAGALNGRKSAIRTMYSTGVERKGRFVIFTFRANGFLPHQVRMMVGSLVKIGTGKMSIEGLRGLLDSGRPGMGGPALPPQGLCLTNIKYKDFPPTGDELK